MKNSRKYPLPDDRFYCCLFFTLFDIHLLQRKSFHFLGFLLLSAVTFDLNKLVLEIVSLLEGFLFQSLHFTAYYIPKITTKKRCDMRNMEVVRLCSETLQRANSKPTGKYELSHWIQSIFDTLLPQARSLSLLWFSYFFETRTQIGCFNFISSRNCKVSESLYWNKNLLPIVFHRI